MDEKYIILGWIVGAIFLLLGATLYFTATV
jgi:hypothetical protein